MVPAKDNLFKGDIGFSFKIEPAEVDGGIGTSRVAWGADTHIATADDVLANHGEHGAVAEAKELLADILKDGPVLKTRIMEEATKSGISERSLWRAKESLGIEAKPSYRLGREGDRKSYWAMLGSADQSPK